jgi:hypothetical protein
MTDYKIRLYREYLTGTQQGSGSITISGNTVTLENSIPLIGIGVVDYPQSISEALLWQLENFSSPTAPANSMRGQLWFNNSDNKIYVDTTGDGDWEAINKETAGIKGDKGDQGDKGDPGDPLNWRFEWNSGSTYANGDAVSYSGSSYISLADGNMNQIPPNFPAAWGVIAERGTQGTAGPAGTNGTSITGPTGPKGDKGEKGDTGDTGTNGTNSYTIHVVTTEPTSGGYAGDLWVII